MSEFNPENTAVVVVDMQNSFCHEDGSLFAEPSKDAIEPIRELVLNASDTGASIVYTRDVHSEDQFDNNHYYDEFDRWGEHVLEDSWDAELVDNLPTEDADLVVPKNTYDAFYDTTLDEWLSDNNIDDLLICGTLANVCVLHTAGSAGLRDYKPVIVTDALGYITEEHKEYAVEHADWLFGETETTDEILFS
jgi:nicotinamidase-related amidase